MTKRSPYSEEEARPEICTSERKYLFLYPMVKQRRWYGLAPEERGRIMKSHIEVGRRYPEITINTTYSYGLDDQEFVVCFEGDDPGEFLDLVNELRPTESSEYTERETPIFTCVAMSVGKALDALDGAASAVAGARLGELRRPRLESLSFRVPHEQDRHPENPLRVAIIGAGPSGFYAAEHILKDGDSTPRSTSSTACPPPSGWSAAASRPTIRRSSR